MDDPRASSARGSSGNGAVDLGADAFVGSIRLLTLRICNGTLSMSWDLSLALMVGLWSSSIISSSGLSGSGGGVAVGTDLSSSGSTCDPDGLLCGADCSTIFSFVLVAGLWLSHVYVPLLYIFWSWLVERPLSLGRWTYW